MTRPPAGAEDPGRDAEFDDLVQRTSGLQPWRRVLHVAAGLIVVLWVSLWDPPRGALLGLLGSAFGASWLFDLLRLQWPVANRAFFRTFTSMASPRESGRIASSTYYALGVFLVFLLFPNSIALPSTLVLAVADPTGNLVGRRLGKHPFGTGTVEGTSALVLASFLAALVFVSPLPALAAALFVGIVETRRWSLDDNLTVPLAAALVLWLTTSILP